MGLRNDYKERRIGRNRNEEKTEKLGAQRYVCDIKRENIAVTDVRQKGAIIPFVVQQRYGC